MRQFIIHRHNHADWQTRSVKATNFEDAARKVVYSACRWLHEYPHEITFRDGKYKVDYTGEPRSVALGMTQHPGYWWSEEIRQGEVNDCKKCGGTGKNHYISWKQCWACGNDKLDGKGSGKSRDTLPREEECTQFSKKEEE